MTDQTAPDQPLTRDTVEPVVARARFDASGLLPAIIQDAVSRDVLMMGWMDEEALRRTLTEGRVTFHKGLKGRTFVSVLPAAEAAE